MIVAVQNIRLLLQKSIYYYPISAIKHIDRYKNLCTTTSCYEKNPLVKKLLDGLLCGKRASLAEAITLVETSNIKKKVLAKELLNEILYLRNKENIYNNTFRIGLSGPPGAGKSTFIECLGIFLTNKGLKVAVLAIDPSSTTNGGSILGDKTRMPKLSCDINAYIRPSPARGHLGGVTRSTNEAIVLCEAAGYDIIIVETIGVGQSEVSVADMVDMFTLIIPPGGGDELQGIKKGIMELCDIIVINKADGDLVSAAQKVKYEYISALKYMNMKNKNWKPVVHCVSSIHGSGIEELWNIMMKYRDILNSSGCFAKKRKEQQKAWMMTHLKDNVLTTFLHNSAIKNMIKDYENLVMEGNITPGDGADIILKYIIQTFQEKK